MGPLRRRHDGVDHLGQELVAVLDVLRVLLGIRVEVGVDHAHRGERPGCGVGIELVDLAQVGGEPGQRCLVGPDERGGQAAVVVLPRDVVGVERLEDRAVGRRRTREHVGQQAQRRPGHQEAPVGVGLGTHRAEVAVADRERRRQGVHEREDVGLEVAHRHRPALTAHEPVVGTVGVRGPEGVPGVVGLAVRLARVVHGECPDRGVRAGRSDRRARRPRIDRGGLPRRVQGEPVAPAPLHADHVVVGVVLHHHHDDVLDLGQLVGPGGGLGIGQLARLEHLRRGRRGRRRCAGGRRRGVRRGRARSEPDGGGAGQRPPEERPSRKGRGLGHVPHRSDRADGRQPVRR